MHFNISILFRHINLAHCTLTGKGVNNLCQALITNKLSLNSLTYLNLSGNCLKEEVTSLVNFLAQPNVVSILDLSSTEVPSELLFGALVRGCTTHLSHLNLARNPFCARKSKGDIPPTFKQFFATTLGLKYLNLSHGKLPLEALKALLLGLACNEATGDVELNISTQFEHKQEPAEDQSEGGRPRDGGHSQPHTGDIPSQLHHKVII